MDISHKILLQNIVFKILDGSEQVVWISIINALILLPFIFLFSLSGYISDRYNKKDVLVYGALSSFTLSVLMMVAYELSSFYLAMFVLLLLAVQSAIYSPAKFGIILDIYGKDGLARGNSLLQSISIIAILFTMGIFSFLFESFYQSNQLESITTNSELLHALKPLAYAILPIAFLEMMVSFLVLKKLSTQHEANESLQLNKAAYFKGKIFLENIKWVSGRNIIFLSVIGLSVFWGISQGMLAVFPAYAKEYLGVTNVFVINGVLAASGIGIAIGSLLYSRVSQHYIEVGTIPLAAIGMTVMIYISTLVETALGLGISFLIFGIFGGLFVVPLNALIQFNSKLDQLGRVLAGNNWFQSVAMLLVLMGTMSVSLYEFNTLDTIYLIIIITLLGTFYTIYHLPQSMFIFFVKWIAGLKYKLEVDGISNIPSSGGVLLLGNHVSWIDWAIIQMATPRSVKFVMEKDIYEKWFLNWFLRFFHVIPISSTFSKSTIKSVAQALDEGSVVVIFPEGAITHNGHMGEFKRGFEKVLELTQTDVKVVAFYIRGLWESMFSRANKKMVKSYRTNSVTVSFSEPMKKQSVTCATIKDRIIELTTQSWKSHIEVLQTIPEEIMDKMKEMGSSHLAVADSTGVELNGHKFLTASILFKNLLSNQIKGQNLGLLMPSTSAGAFLNLSALMLGKTVVNLNYTAELAALKAALGKAEVQTIVTSKKFIEKLKEKGMPCDEVLMAHDVIYVEDLKAQIKKSQGLMVLLSVKLLPSFILKRLYIKKVKKDDTAIILFSSGSEGSPKGIELTHDNVVGNAQQIASVLNVNDEDIILGSLPLFHAFGTVVTCYMPLIEGITVAFHPDPTDGFAIGKLVKQHQATIMFGTSTFFRLYTKNKKVEASMFKSLRFIVAGAEKLDDKVRHEFKKKFSKEILEGFGTTETSPVASCNLPDVLTAFKEIQVGEKRGTVGMPIPGTAIKIVDPDTFEPLSKEEAGMVLIRGVQVMKGYLKDPEKTKSVLIELEGKTWYVTGDKGRFDEDGFLTIVDRYSRFAKIGGEMVGLGTVEQRLRPLIESEEVDYLVSAVKDDKKGERLVLLVTNMSELQLSELKASIIKAFDNKLMIPSDYKIVEEIPTLGSGKRDFAKAKQLAQ